MAISRLCSVDGCGKPHEARNYCDNHYRQALRVIRKSRPHELRIGRPAHMPWVQSHVAYVGEECLLWPFPSRKGRACTTYKNLHTTASRLMCTMAHGEPPTPEHEAAHSCGNGHLNCCNPNHLRWATRLENQADKVNHGTSVVCLSDNDVRSIRTLQGIKTVREIAAIYGAHYATISKIQNGLTRKGVA